MGYYTRYDLNVKNCTKKFYREIESDLNCFESDYTWNDVWETLDPYKVKGTLFASQYSKWYSHNQDMLAISKRHPTLTFVLDGEGEETADIWRAFYRNGEQRMWRLPLPKPPETWEDCI